MKNNNNNQNMSRMEKIQLLNQVKKGLVSPHEISDWKVEFWTSDHRVNKDVFTNEKTGELLSRKALQDRQARADTSNIIFWLEKNYCL
jgi:hypothetical protein